MKKLLAIAAVVSFACAAPAFAADAKSDPAKTTNSQNTKMTECNAKAGDKKGDERKAFMSSCLSSKPAKTTQSEKMSACNKKTAGLKGDERNKAQSECMKAA